MKILVTGSNGLLGQKLTEKLRSRPDIALIATARGENRFPFKEGYIYESLDITDAAQTLEVIKKHHPDCIINTAAMTNVDACETDQAGCDALNILGVHYLTRAANEVSAHLIHLSTDFIFNGTHGPLTEDEPAHPLSYYGDSKLSGEKAVMEGTKCWSILRTVLVYGITPDMSRSNIVLWAKNSLEAGKEISVVDDQFRTPTLAEDLADGCILCATKKAQGIYNISGRDFMSIFDLVMRVCDHFGLDKNLVKRSKSSQLNQAAIRPPITGFRIEKAVKNLAYRPHSFEDGLDIMMDQMAKLNNQ
jgi:dTDP-4-dehydrorhamnose reductase